MEAIDTRNIPLRFHMLREMDKSPRHAFYAMRAAVAEQRESREMEVGSATHAMLFQTTTVVAAPMPRNEKHKAWQEFQAAHEGCYIVTQAEYDKASRLCDAVRSHHIARELVEAQGALHEQTRYGEREGRITRCTPDVWHPAYIADLKTTEEVSPTRMAAHMRTYDIAGQLEWYLGGIPEIEAYIIAVESGTCIVQVYKLSEACLNEAAERNISRLRRLMECEERGFFPSYSSDVLEITQAPPWKRLEVEEA